MAAVGFLLSALWPGEKSSSDAIHQAAAPVGVVRDRADLRGRRKPIIGDLHFRTHVFEDRAVRVLRVELSSARQVELTPQSVDIRTFQRVASFLASSTFG